jgi:hypothetical protein
LLNLAQGKGIKSGMLVDILRAQRINGIMGGVAVMPWEVDQLPGDWQDAFDALAVDFPQMRKGQAEVEATKAALKHG